MNAPNTAEYTFYKLRSEKQREKTELLKLMNVEVLGLGFSHTEKTAPGGKPDCKVFYQAAVTDIRLKMANRSAG